MNPFELIGRLTGLSKPADAGSATPTGVAMPVQAEKAESVNMQKMRDPYADLWQAVNRQLSAFMSNGVMPHLHYEPDDLFNLVRIQVEGETAEAQEVLERYFKEFKPASRRKAVQNAVNSNCPRGVSVKDFVDLDSSFEQTALEESDPYAAQLAEVQQSGFKVTLFGEWKLQEPVLGTASSSASATGPELLLDVRDASGAREMRIGTFPFVVGRETPAGGQALTGTYLSRRHGVLERDAAGLLWFRDTSVNGSTLDGVAVTSGDRRQLFDGSVLVLGGTGASHKDCPKLTVCAGAGAAGMGATPLRVANPAPVHAATPLRAATGPAAVTPVASTTLCMLALQDAHGTRTLAVTHLPFVIGRDENADCRIPEANSGVSRQHLVITALDAAGASINNAGAEPRRWGTEVGGVEQAAQFFLPWAGHATLAHRYSNAPAVKLQLLAPLL